MIKRWLYTLITIVLFGGSHLFAGGYNSAQFRADTSVVGKTETSAAVPDTDTLNSVATGDSVVAPVSKADTVPSIKEGREAFWGIDMSDSLRDVSAGSGRSLWEIVITAVLWGLVTFFMLTFYPIVPSTISSLRENVGSKRAGSLNSLLFCSAIVVFFVLPPTILFSVIYIICGYTGSVSLFSWFATHWIPNILFFIIFLLFSASFFGAFEFKMQAAAIKKVEERAEQGGITSHFFKVLLVVLISLATTVPMVGTVFIRSIQGAIREPIITMFAFSVAFALPFALFLFFPVLLKYLPQGGGRTHSLKVFLGFTEIILGLIFLSTADQIYGWGVLDREIFLAILIVILTLLGLYLLGEIRFKGDAPVVHLSIPRLIIAISVFACVAYLIPGMWGAPLKAVSGSLPPIETEDFRLIQSSSQIGGEESAVKSNPIVKYANIKQLKMIDGMSGFYDYSQALDYSAKMGKPVFLYFTGKACAECREMETKVLGDERVQKILRERYIVLVMYGDVRYNLHEDDWVITPNGKILKSIGKINTNILITKYGVTVMPSFLLLDSKGLTLSPTRGYNLNLNAFINYLNRGYKAFL